MSVDVVKESVPPFIKRIGDRVLQGSNNSLLVLGTDRAKAGPATVDDGLGDAASPTGGVGAGMAHLVVGRHDKSGDPDFTNDDSFIYVSMKTQADTNLGLSAVEGVTDDNLPAAIVKSDVVRTVFRKSIKVSADDGSSYVYADKNYLTANVNGFFVKIDKSGVTVTAGQCTAIIQPAQAQVKLGQTTLTLTPASAEVNSPVIKISGPGAQPWDQLFQQFQAFMVGHDHLTAVGPTTPGAGGPASAALAIQLAQAFTQWQSTSFGG